MYGAPPAAEYKPDAEEVRKRPFLRTTADMVGLAELASIAICETTHTRPDGTYPATVIRAAPLAAARADRAKSGKGCKPWLVHRDLCLVPLLHLDIDDNLLQSGNGAGDDVDVLIRMNPQPIG